MRSEAVAPWAAGWPRGARPRAGGSAGGRAGLAPQPDAAEFTRMEVWWFGFFLIIIIVFYERGV